MLQNSDQEENQQAIYREKQETLTQSRASMLGLRYEDSRKFTDVPLYKEVLDLKEMYDMHIFPLLSNQNEIQFAITLETPQSLLRQIRDRYQDKTTSFVMISTEGFKEMMLRYDPPAVVQYDDITVSKEGDSDNLDKVSQTLDTVKANDILDYIINQADRTGASDIHLECAREFVRIRYRLNGALHLIAKVTHEKYMQIQQSIAVKAGIGRNSPDTQTGHMSQVVSTVDKDGNPENKILNMRIETVPTVFGQDAVIRLFNFNVDLLDLDKIGLSERERAPIDEVISHPHGLALMVGPTGSGKTTTLYAILNKLRSPSNKIITLEDPVEYTLDGTSQIPINTQGGDSFANKLRAVMRLDPDVIMVGEIRDVDTARTAMQASVTGHLVLSTFHASSAAAALSRMVDMIGQNPIFISAIQLIISQRLVRKLDDSTKQAYEPDENLKKHIRETLESLPSDIDKPDLSEITLYKPGSSEENPFGFTERMSIMEELVVDESIQELLRDVSQVVTIDQIESQARANGMLTMYQDGLLKALQGLTTLEEVNRVI